MTKNIILKIPAKLVFVEIAAVFLQEIMNEAPFDCKKPAVSVAIKDLLSRIILSDSLKKTGIQADIIKIIYIVSDNKIEIDIFDFRKSLQLNNSNILNKKRLYGNVFNSFSYYSQKNGFENLHKLTIIKS